MKGNPSNRHLMDPPRWPVQDFSISTGDNSAKSGLPLPQRAPLLNPCLAISTRRRRVFMELKSDTPPRLVAATFPPFWSPQSVASPTSLFRQRGEWGQGPLLDLPSPANCHEIAAEVSVTDCFPLGHLRHGGSV
ncbi:hypothetical protein FPOAC2_10931 [Fusarium poae]|jgi:hypothetical protein